MFWMLVKKYFEVRDLYLLYQFPMARGLGLNGHSPQEWLCNGSPPPNFSRQINSLLVPPSKTVNEEWEHFFLQ